MLTGRRNTMRQEYLQKMLQRAAHVKSAIQLLEKLEKAEKQNYTGYGRKPRYEGEWTENALVVREHYNRKNYEAYRQICLDNKKVLSTFRKSGIPGLYVYLERINRHIRGYIWGNVVKKTE